ncbi:MAG TPA: SGNH/GDSL hydrolase family protein [Dinghuibacter sp.]|uniref:SGNH/GDSL hydrolase family protein n=1 Tax=Dinghuibacter sp. TaxID=2024697 RepID=UPI002CAC1EA1|nr:SGNH/GDSL hydrolase family protein [Dinghuibacter sp.]HTJ11758.1 SGNH/GDSL hydrolase family protein [Dinghuibacter sp.]
MRKMIVLGAAALLTSFIKPPIRWVAIGDSITYLNDHTDETGGRLKKGYLSRVTELLPNVQYVNQGHNGWTSRGIARAIDKLGIPEADVYTVFLGTNDWWSGDRVGKWADYERGTGDTTVYGSFRVIVNKIRSLNNSARVVLITPMPRTDFVYINDAHNNAYGSYKPKAGQTLEQVVDAIRDIGRREHFTVIDLYHDHRFALRHLVRFKRLKDPATGAYKDYGYPEYTKIPWSPSDDYPYPPEAMDMTYDGLHPSDKGDSAIAGELVKVF